MAADTNTPQTGFLKKAMGLFVESDTAPAKAPTPKFTAPASPSGSGSAVRSAALYDTDMLNTLNGVISKRTSAYTTLITQAENLRDEIPDDGKRIRIAFKTIGGGRTAGDVIKALDVHIADVERERLNFAALTQNQISANAGKARTEASQLTSQNESNAQTVAALTQQIAKLQEQISSNAQRIQELTSSADNAEAEARSVESRFNATAEYVKNDLTNKKQSLTALLG